MCVDCKGVFRGGVKLDNCGVCGGDGSTCTVSPSASPTVLPSIAPTTVPTTTPTEQLTMPRIGVSFSASATQEADDAATVTIVSSAGSACFALVVICIFVLWWRARHKDLEELIKLEDQDGELGLLSPPELAITSITSPANPQSTTPMVLKRDRQRSVTPVSARRLPASRPGTPERRLPRAVAKYIDASRFLGITSPGGMSSATPPSGSTTPPRGARLDVSSTPQTRTLRVAGHIVNDSMPRVVGRYVAAKHALPALRHVTPAKNRPASTPPVLQRPPSSPSEQNIVLQRPPSPPSERKITLPTRPHSPPRERTPPPLRDATPPKASSPGARRSVRQIVPPRLLPLRDDQTIPPPLVASDLSPPPLRDATPPPSPPFSNPSFYDPTHTITEAHMTLKAGRRVQSRFPGALE